MEMNKEYTAQVEKLANSGLGLVKADGFVVFIKNACPEDIIKFKITKVNKNYAFAEILDIIEPSKYRTKPFCPLHNVCGACRLQFIDYKYQLEVKRQIVEDTIKTISGLNLIPLKTIASPQTQNYRHKVQYPVSETKNSHRIIAGYYKPETHEAVNIKYCPIQPEICDEIIEFIRQKAFDYAIHGYNEKKHSGDLRHVLIRVSHSTKKCLVTLVVNATKTFDRLNDFAKCIYDEFEQVTGVCINFNPKRTNVITGKQTICIEGNEFIEEKIAGKNFKIGSDTFFQINPESAENIFNYVKNYISDNFENAVVLDAYAGISAFGICVSDVSKKVVSVEENKQACELAKISAKENNINNLEVHNADATEFLKTESRKFDVIILDPPRKGCTKESLEAVLRLAKSTIIYISCNPATLARDLKFLSDNGAKVQSVQPFDMFAHTCHIENVAIITVNPQC